MGPRSLKVNILKVKIFPKTYDVILKIGLKYWPEVAKTTVSVKNDLHQAKNILKKIQHLFPVILNSIM